LPGLTSEIDGDAARLAAIGQPCALAVCASDVWQII
jgi:hypothetical protein